MQVLPDVAQPPSLPFEATDPQAYFSALQQIDFDAVKADPRTQTVLRGESSMGELEQYYQAADSKDVCRDGDERGRWG